MNKWSGAGRLTKDPEVRYTQSGKAVCGFTVACNRRHAKDSNQPTADFVSCVAWEKTAEIIGQYCHKGSKVAVEGPIQTRSYDAQDGSKRYVTEVIVREIDLMDSKPAAGGSQAAAPSSGAGQFGPSVPDEEIPF